MSVKLTNFVKIDIKRHLANQPEGLRDTAVLLCVDSAAATINNGKPLTSDTYEALTESGQALENYKTYLDIFFKNGGRKLYVEKITAPADGAALKSVLEKLPFSYCIVGITGPSTSTQLDPTSYASKCDSYNQLVIDDSDPTNGKIYQKIFFMDAPTTSGNDVSAYTAIDKEMFVLKYGDYGVSAAALAYYTKFNIYSADATQDYAYTTELFMDSGNDGHYVFDDNTLVKNALDNLNVDITLAGQIRNVGGNDTAQNDLTNEYMLLVLHQTLTERLVNLLVQKIRFNDKGMAAVINAITKELNAYVSNGFLTTNKVWNDGDLYYKNYKIIDDNTMLNTGYKIAVMPYETLTPAEVKEHQFPEIYILIADSYSIRKIVITGEVF